MSNQERVKYVLFLSTFSYPHPFLTFTTTVRSRDTQLWATRTLQTHCFKLVLKHGHIFFARFLSYKYVFSVSKYRVYQGHTVSSATLSNYNRTPSIYKVIHPMYYKHRLFTLAATIDCSCLAYRKVVSSNACY